jgi:hypothetical protein
MKRLLALLVLAACADAPSPDLQEAQPDAVQARVDAAMERLGSTPSGQRVREAIEAHGGLAAWYGGGPLRFRYAYQRLTPDGEPTGAPIDTRQIVDVWSARAVHTLLPDSSARFGWTGDEAWIYPPGAQLPTNARFWALTPYYFVAMPFVLADDGVTLALAAPDTVEGRPADVVRVTFEPGTGDAPDDYYDLLLDPATSRVRGVRYVVSYPGFFPDGGQTPETTMLYDGEQSPGGGIVLQQGFRSFASASMEPRARGTLTDLRFDPSVPDSAFARPAGAHVQSEM